MLVSIYNVRVVRRGVPEGDSLYYLAAGGDTLLATDRASSAVAPDSLFLVREGDRLGRISGIVMERSVRGGRAYLLEPRRAGDYFFMAGSRVLTTWGRLKRAFW